MISTKPAESAEFGGRKSKEYSKYRDRLANLGAGELLNVSIGQPEKVFSGLEDLDKQLYRWLRKEWHPDNKKEEFAGSVFQHINILYKARRDLIAAGLWGGPGQISLESTAGKRLVFKFMRQKKFELGQIYEGRSSILYVIDFEYKELYLQGVGSIKNLKFADAQMEREFKHCLPLIEKEFETNRQFAVILEKRADLVPLDLLLSHFGDALDPRHVAWILSGLFNLACFLRWAGLTHNGLDLSSYYVSPPEHSGTLLGGWWYARPSGARLNYLPKDIARCAPRSVLDRKTATPRLDGELIRRIGRTLLGDESGAKLLRNKKVPEGLAKWLMIPGGEDAVEEYKRWEQVRTDNFGARRFTELSVTLSDIYGSITS